jgi:putative spermidine/putrescine transport system substrate-binding protein
MPNGGPDEIAQRLLLKPYTEAGGLKLVVVPWESGSPESQKTPAPDLVLANGPQLAAGCKAQSLNRLDWGRLNRDRYQPGAVSDCGVGAYQETTVLAWDPAKLSTPPNWGDFWDVARHPGRRGLQRTARTTLEIALLADGVAPNDLYRTLRTPEGQDRAFRKLDQLKPYVIWWDKPAEAAQALATGKVLLTAAPAAAVLKLETEKRHFGVQWNASLASWQSWAVPHDSAQPEAAALALLVAGDLARQAGFAAATLEAPSARDAFALLPPAPLLQAAAGAGLAVDDGFWAEEGEKLESRFTVWLSK